jgi:hypothetical protein
MLAMTNQAMLFLMLLGALMLKVQQGFSATGIYEEGYDASLVEALLICSALAVAICAIVAITFSVVGVLASRRDQAEGTDATDVEYPLDKAIASGGVNSSNKPTNAAPTLAAAATSELTPHLRQHQAKKIVI